MFPRDEHGAVGIREGSKGGQRPPLANDLACKV